MRRSSFSRLVVLTSCLLAGATLISSPAEAQRKKAPAPSSGAAPAPRKKRAAPLPPPPVAEAPIEAAPEPAPVEEELPPVAPAPPPAPVRRAAAPPVAPIVEDTTTDLGPPPQRSIRKKPKSTRPADVDTAEDDDGQPIRRKKAPVRHSRRDIDEEENDIRATKRNDADDDEDEPPAKEADADEEDSEPEPESDTDTDTDSPARKRRRPKPFLVDVTAALRGFQRHFAYVDDPYNELPNYDLGGAPAIALDVAVYPFKNKRGSLSAGFTGSFEYAVGVGTTYKVPTGDQEGTKGTTALAYALGVRGNYAFGATMANIISAGAEFGAQSFIIDHPPPVRGNANIPNVEYKFIRPNVQGRFPVSSQMSVLGSLGYLMVSSAGEIVSPDYFRGATSSASGFDLGAGIAYEIKMSTKGTIKFLELRPMLTYRRYAFTFNPADDDPFISSGATDEYLGLNLGAATRF